MLTPAVLNIRSQLAITSSLLVPLSRVETFIVLYIGLPTYHASKAASSVLTTVSEGELTPIEGIRVIMGLIDSYRRTLELIEIEERLQALEQAYYKQHFQIQ